ncbi:MAG: PorT family protein [Paludibacteraceae bacterium]|nr:PorT family protein [Paludibacteraceae bacterium]
MKRHITILIVLLDICLHASAQGLGIQLGYTHASERYKAGASGKYQAFSPLNGFSLGAAYEYDFYKGLGLSAGLNYVFGAQAEKETTNSGYLKTTKTSRVRHAMEIPVMLQWRIRIAKQSYILTYGGPTLQIGLYYKGKRSYDSPMIQQEDDIFDFYTDNGSFYHLPASATLPPAYINDKLNRVNLMMGFGLGLQFRQFQLKGGYDWGLLNNYADNHTPDGSTWLKDRQDQWYIRFAYFFELKKTNK